MHSASYVALCRQAAGPAPPALPAGTRRRCRRRAGPCRAASGPQAWQFDDLSGAPAGVASFDDLWQHQMRAMERAQAEMADMQRQMDQRFEAAQREAAQLERQAGGSGGRLERVGGAGGPCGYRWHSSERRTGPGGSFHAFRSESFTVIGVPGGCSMAPPSATHLGPLPAAGLLLAAALAGFWAAATAAFNRRFGAATSYDERSRWWMLLAWPLLLLLSADFRRQFWGALRGPGACVGGEQPDGGSFAPSLPSK